MTYWISNAPYVQISRHGVFRYRRVVPPSLRSRLLKREIVTSLRTKDRREAQTRYLTAHIEAEALLASINGMHVSAHERQDGPALAASARPVSTPSNVETLDSKGRPTAPGSITATDALRVYLVEKKEEFDSYSGRLRKIRYDEKRRVIKYLIDSLSEDKDIRLITRDDARCFRDYLRDRGLAAGSIKKIVSVSAAIIQSAIVEHQLAIRNPLHRLPIRKDVSDRDARLPLSPDEIVTVRSMGVNNELLLIVDMLALTGSRLAEITGLEWGDLSPSAPDGRASCIRIRSNRLRRLKTRSSERTVPMLEEVERLLRLYDPAWQSQPNSVPVFPRYGRSGGADAASAALMKALRKAGITDPRKSIHSIRHSVKQALRDVGCPKDVRDAIQGHAHNSISENYGTGHSLEVMAGWLTKAMANLEV